MRTRPEEQFAFEVLRRVLGVEFTEFDDNTRPRQVDALFIRPDGGEGALEVTTIGDPAAIATESSAARRDWSVAGARWAWCVWCGPDTRLDALRIHLDSLVLSCEAIGVTTPDEVPWEHRAGSPAFEWVAEADLSMHGFPESKRPGAIDVLPRGGSGAVPNDVEAVPTWLEIELAAPLMEGKLQKLRDTGRDDLHLFLRLHESGVPFPIMYGLAYTAAVPRSPFVPPHGLHGLWLAPRWSNPLLRWGSDVGWRREDCLG